MPVPTLPGRFRPKRFATFCGALLLALGLGAPALAHPFGMPPVAEIAAAGDKIRTTFSVALDDTLIMFSRVGVPEDAVREMGPDALATLPEVNAYLTTTYVLSVPEGPCSGQTTGARKVGFGFLFFLDHTCPAPVGTDLHVANEFLRDVSPDYRLVIVARVGAHKPRWTLEAGVSEMDLDLTPPPPGQPVEAEPEESSTTVKGLERLFSFLDDGRGFGAVFVALGIATVLGALHGLTPGHGKALVAAYLAGSDAKVRHAFAVGAALTVTHTAAVIAFGVVALVAGKALVPQQVEPILMSVAAGLVVCLGLWLLLTRIRTLRRGHDHTHEHPHASERALSGKGLIAVGAAGGIVPCPEAFGLLFVAISLGRVSAGLLLLVAFSIGLASVLVAIAVTLVLSRRALAPRLERSRTLRFLPVVSALLVTTIGVALGVVAAGKF